MRASEGQFLARSDEGQWIGMRRRRLIAVTSRLVSLAGAGDISSARKLFDEMPERDTVAWNAMITAYSLSGHPLQALNLLSRMRSSISVRPDSFSLTAALAASADLRDLSSGRKLHAFVCRIGLLASLPVSNSLIDMYGKCFRPMDAAQFFEETDDKNEISWCSLLHGYVNSGLWVQARRLFELMPRKTMIAWNILIAGYAQFGETGSCLCLFKEMVSLGFQGDAATFASLMNACSDLSDSSVGCMIHAFVLQRGFSVFAEVSNSLLSFYAKFDLRDDATKVFESMETRTQVSWNAMIDTNMKYGDVERATALFRMAPETNIVSWTALIAGLSRNGYGEEALRSFVDMMRNSLRPDDFTVGAVLHACAVLTSLANGKMVHGCTIHSGLLSYLYVANGLVNMYSKCGDVEASARVFGSIAAKDLVSWNTMLFGFAMNGLAVKVFDLYSDMLTSDAKPDKVTFMGLLMACSHSGLVEQGKAFFEVMQSDHDIEPDKEHVTCIVDILARAGRFDEACKLSEGNPRLADDVFISSIEALLAACAIHGDVNRGGTLGKRLLTMEPLKEVGYVMLSNLYCGSGQWKEAENVRRVMIEQGLKKSPGCSWIEVRGMAKVFVSGNQSLDDMKDVAATAELLNYQMRNPIFDSLVE